MKWFFGRDLSGGSIMLKGIFLSMICVCFLSITGLISFAETFFGEEGTLTRFQEASATLSDSANSWLEDKTDRAEELINSVDGSINTVMIKHSYPDLEDYGIGENIEIGDSDIRAFTEIGDDVTIGDGVLLAGCAFEVKDVNTGDLIVIQGHVHIGEDSTISDNVIAVGMIDISWNGSVGEETKMFGEISIKEDVEIGSNVEIGDVEKLSFDSEDKVAWPSYFEGGKSVSIGEGVKIGNNVKISEHVHIEPGVVIGDGTGLKEGAYIRQGVTIGPGVIIGENEVVTENRS